MKNNYILRYQYLKNILDKTNNKSIIVKLKIVDIFNIYFNLLL